MEEKQTIKTAVTKKDGRIEISPAVVEVIVGIAASEVEGVYGMQGSFRYGINRLLGRHESTKGVYLSGDQSHLVVDLYCYIRHGISVPEVAIKIQEKVKEQVYFSTDLVISEVNIHVVNIVPAKLVEEINFSNLLDMGELV